MTGPRYGIFGRVKTQAEHEWLHDNIPLLPAGELAREFRARFGWAEGEFTAHDAHQYGMFRLLSCAADDGTPRPQFPDARCEYARMGAMLRGGATVSEVRALFWEEFGWMPSPSAVRTYAKGLGLPKPELRRKRRPAARAARAAGAGR